MSTPIRIEGPPVEDVTPEQITEAVEQFRLCYLIPKIDDPPFS